MSTHSTLARHILNPRNRFARVRQRLQESMNSARPVTLAVGEVSVLVSMLDRAIRLAEGAQPEADELTQLRLELRKTTAAWEAAERRVHQLEQGRV